MSIYLGSELLGGTSHDTVSNAHSLLDYKWTDHKLNEMAWLRADTWSWQSGKVYEAAYNHLVADLSSAELKTETFNGITITYYVAKDGHKIAYESEIIKVSDIFESLGTAWWYIIDIPNKRFKLPRSTHGDIVENYQNGSSWYRLYADGWVEQGGHITTEVATVTFLIPMINGYYTALATGTGNGNAGGSYIDGTCTIYNKTTTGMMIHSLRAVVQGDWEVKGKVASNISAEAPSKYLYFYVGDYSQSAIEQTAGITSEELANKIDLPDNVTQSTCDFVIDAQAPTAENNYTWYRLYKSGWVEQGGRGVGGSGATVTLPKTMIDNGYYINLGGGNSTGWGYAPHSFTYYDITSTSFKVRLEENSSQAAGMNCSWEVKGVAAQS